MDSKPTLFVSIASYRDSELIPTLHDMITRASHPASLNITVCWQHDEDITLFLAAGMMLEAQQKQNNHDLFIFTFQGARIEAISVHYYQSEGACWARSLCESRYAGEDYFLQIDSHCRFIENWDKEMVSLYRQLQTRSQRPVLSAYPPGYNPGDEEEKADYVSRLVFREFSRDGIVTLTSTPFTSDVPKRGSYIAGGFIFSAGTFVTDIPNDPYIFFEGEEIAMAARAFTHGYDVYYPHKILLWHFYGRGGHQKVWSDHNVKAKESGKVELVWWDRDRASKKRVRMLLGLEPDDGSIATPYRLGAVRTLREFEYALGLEFKSASLLPDVIEEPRRAYFDYQNCSEKEWIRRLITHHKKPIKIGKDRFDQETAGILYWHIGIYNDANDLVADKQMTQDDIAKIMTESSEKEFTIEMNFKSYPSIKNYVIRICPYIDVHGWGKVIENTW